MFDVCPGRTCRPFPGSLALLLIGSGNAGGQVSRPRVLPPRDVIAGDSNPAIEWNQIFLDSLIATNTANSSSQRLGAIVHAAIFDAHNGIERRYSPVFIQDPAPRGASRRAAVIAAAYTALATLSRHSDLCWIIRYVASLAALNGDDEDAGQSRERGIDSGTAVALKVLAWRAADGFNVSEHAVHRRNSGWPMAAHASSLHSYERSGIGVYSNVYPAEQPAISPRAFAAFE